MVICHKDCEGSIPNEDGHHVWAPLGVDATHSALKKTQKIGIKINKT